MSTRSSSCDYDFETADSFQISSDGSQIDLDETSEKKSEVRLHIFTTQLQCTHIDAPLEEIRAEIECRLQQMSEVHDFIDQMTSEAGPQDSILLCGDFNMFCQPMSAKTKDLLRTTNSIEAQRKASKKITEVEASTICE